jgi:hypothetical protein
VRGPGASGESAAWPQRLEALLRQRLPNVDITVQVHGGRGLTAADQWQLIVEALRDAGGAAGSRPDLIIWQAGATEAVRGLPVESLTEALLPALDRLRRLGIDTVVMDLQFSRFLRANADVTAYREALAVVAAGADVPLFDRYALMQAWADAERVDVERAPRGAPRTAMVDKLNDCLARALVEFLLDGAREARR